MRYVRKTKQYLWSMTSHIVLLRSVRRLLVTVKDIPNSPIPVTLMMEAIRYSETSVITRATRLNIPEDDILHSHCRENLKSYISLTCWTLWKRRNVSPVKYELGFYIPEDDILHSHSRENLNSYTEECLISVEPFPFKSFQTNHSSCQPNTYSHHIYSAAKQLLKDTGHFPTSGSHVKFMTWIHCSKTLCGFEAYIYKYTTLTCGI
jgi:hypothetical protein